MKSLLILGLSTVLIGTTTSATYAANLVGNGDFETGFLGWTQSGNNRSPYIDNTDAYSGTSSAALDAVGSLGFLSQNLVTTLGETYSLTYYLESDGSTPNEFKTTVGGNVLFDQTNIPEQSFSKYKSNFAATSSSTQLEFGFKNDPGFLHLDKVSVNVAAVPEPSESLGILLIGFLGVSSLIQRALRQQSIGKSANS